MKEYFASLAKWEKMKNLFNVSPKKFLSHIFEGQDKGELFEDAASKVAIFLRYSPYIQVQKMIEILGGYENANISILKKYIGTFDLKDITVGQALRIVFSNFLMFGESQMIERVLTEFSRHYFECNPVFPVRLAALP